MSPSQRSMVAENFGSFICCVVQVHGKLAHVDQLGLYVRTFLCLLKNKACNVLALPPATSGSQNNRNKKRALDRSWHVNLTWLRSLICTPQSPTRKKFTRSVGQLKLPMAGLEPARAFYGPTDFKSVASAISPHRRRVRWSLSLLCHGRKSIS